MSEHFYRFLHKTVLILCASWCLSLAMWLFHDYSKQEQAIRAINNARAYQDGYDAAVFKRVRK